MFVVLPYSTSSVGKLEACGKKLKKIFVCFQFFTVIYTCYSDIFLCNTFRGTYSNCLFLAINKLSFVYVRTNVLHQYVRITRTRVLSLSAFSLSLYGNHFNNLLSFPIAGQSMHKYLAIFVEKS